MQTSRFSKSIHLPGLLHLEFVPVAHVALLSLYITTLPSSWISKRLAEKSTVFVAQATERSFFLMTRFPLNWKYRAYMSTETVLVSHNFLPPQYSTKFPSSCSIKVYFPLRDFKDSPFIIIAWLPCDLIHLSL